MSVGCVDITTSQLYPIKSLEVRVEEQLHQEGGISVTSDSEALGAGVDAFVGNRATLFADVLALPAATLSIRKSGRAPCTFGKKASMP